MPLDALPHATARRILLILMAAIYLVFGLIHVATPDPFLPIMPAWVPAPRLVVILTGVCEIAGAIGLVVPRTRWLAGVMLALYAVCVYPANLKHAFDHVAVPQLPSGWWYHGPRLLFQPVFVWWALFCAGVIDWPFRSRRGDRPATG
ncbi:DoxX family protein [Lichenihabitans sp. Uapishka_5]|uniref:DoxX family protein n=1 Tax=Lichenihabitans sp. Uapishka_5 TaxID=3037302 RepID=UPI0029E81E6E|nr:DoxX family protein [Lichenihabitans sp. Uapishka_5]MDX7951084.1 DoxX family protein [Lichenihabitans sp. Uapishka_5]